MTRTHPLTSHIPGKRGLSLAVVGGVVFGVGGEDRDDQNLHTVREGREGMDGANCLQVMMLDSQTGAWVEWHPMKSRR